MITGTIQKWCVAILLLAFCSARTNAQVIIGYYSGNAKQISKYPVNKLTHIIYSFCHLDGNKLWVENRKDSQTIRTLVALKKKNPKLKILLSLGGWGGCKTCSDVFSTDSGRNEFAISVLALNSYFHTDGIDLDWEFPALAAYPDHPFKVEDKVNLTALVQTLRKTLGKTKEISVICAGFSPYLEGSIDLQGVVPYVDRINLMSYDLIGSKTHFSGHASSLYSTSWQTASADHAVRYMDSLKIPHQKIAIGVAFYGRLYQVTENHGHGLDQPAEFQKFVTMKKIRKNYSDAAGYKTYWDAEAHAAYKYNDANKVYLTYDDERSVAAKSAYVKEKKLNGLFFWELRLDRPHQGLLDEIYKKLR
jgi:chitinase